MNVDMMKTVPKKTGRSAALHAGTLVCVLLCLSLTGCVRSAPAPETVPEMTWPAPPDTPRIRYISTIQTPQDVSITENAVVRFFNYIQGKSAPVISAPHGIARDAEGNLYVVDSWIKAVHVFDTANNRYFTFPHDGTAFSSPIDIAVSASGRVFVSDSKEGVVKVFDDRGRTYVKEIGEGFLQRPTGVAIHEGAGELFVADTVDSEIIRYDLATLKFKGRFGTEGKGQGMLHSPTSLTLSPEGDLIVTDSLNFRVQVFSPDGTFRLAFGEAGNAPGYFARPKGVAADRYGNIYVVDALFDNVQIFDREGRHLMAFGSPGYTPGMFWLPSGIFIDGNDRIYVSDTYNNRVQVFELLKGD